MFTFRDAATIPASATKPGMILAIYKLKNIGNNRIAIADK
jgi:hypothetical protein